MPGTEGFLQGREVFLGDKRWSQHWFVAILELKPQGLSSGTPLGSRAGLVVAHANILGLVLEPGYIRNLFVVHHQRLPVEPGTEAELCTYI